MVTFSCAAALVIAAPATPAAAAPSTYTVTSTGDDGDAATRANCAAGADPCTLRAAMLEANAHVNDPAGVDVITFAIPGPAPHLISAASRLPVLTDPVTIDAGLPAPFAPRTVEVTGRDCDDGTPQACDGLVTTVGNTTVRGLAVNGFYQGFRTTPPGSVPLRGVVLQGNFFGTNAAGTTLIGPPSTVLDGGIGVLLELADDAQIGGDPSLGEGNLIAGNRVRQVDVVNASGVAILGNFIGVASDGATPLAPGGGGGISITNGSANQVGAPGAGNVISGLGGPGVFAIQASGLRVQANYIGTDKSGAVPVPNTFPGIDVENSTATTIGGAPDAGNVVAASSMGLKLSDGPNPANGGGEVSYNRIGTDAAGTSDLGNGAGAEIQGHDYYIGHNIVSGNGDEQAGASGFGVSFLAGSFTNRVEDNLVGVGATGDRLGNSGAGIVALYDSFTSSSGNVGTPGHGNEIAYNQRAGVMVSGDPTQDPTPTGVTIRGNSIHDNGGLAGVVGLGIDINTIGDPEGPDGIDDLDADDGANQEQNAPEILDVTTTATATTVTGRLRSTPGQQYTLDLYSNPACDPSGYGEGQTYHDIARTVTTPAIGEPQAGTVPFKFTLPSLPEDAGVAVTATNSIGATSEFSACEPAPAPEMAESAVTYTGPTTGLTYSDPVTLSGRLTDTSSVPATGIAGAQLDFVLGDQAPVHAAPTDANGDVTAAPTVVTVTPGTRQLVTSFSGDTAHAAAQTTTSINVGKEDATLAYVGDTLVSPLAPTRLVAEFSEPDPNHGDLGGRTVTFVVTSTTGATTSYTATTNSIGRAETSQLLNADVYSVNARFDGDEYYVPTVTQTDTLLTVSAAGAKVTGGGWISNTVGRSSFGFNAIPQTDGTFKGQFQLRSNSNRSTFHGPTVNTLRALSRTSVTWTGTGRWNGTPGYAFEVTVVDQGSSGSKKGDTINILIYRVGDRSHPVFTTSTPQPLKGGNITVH